MNTRQARADAETAALLRAIPEAMRPREAQMWLDDYDGRHAKPRAITVTQTAPYRELSTSPTLTSWSRPDDMQQPEQPNRQSTYVGSAWRMNFKTMTLEQVRP